MEPTRVGPSAHASAAGAERAVNSITADAGDVGAPRATGRGGFFDASRSDRPESGRAFAGTCSTAAGAGSKRASSHNRNHNAVCGLSSHCWRESGESSVARQAVTTWWDAGGAGAPNASTRWNAGALRSSVRECRRPSARDGCATCSFCAAILRTGNGRNGLAPNRSAGIQGH